MSFKMQSGFAIRLGHVSRESRWQDSRKANEGIKTQALVGPVNGSCKYIMFIQNEAGL